MWDEVHNKGLENSETKRLTTISPTLGYHMLPPEVIEVPTFGREARARVDRKVKDVEEI